MRLLYVPAAPRGCSKSTFFNGLPDRGSVATLCRAKRVALPRSAQTQRLGQLFVVTSMASEVTRPKMFPVGSHATACNETEAPIKTGLDGIDT